MPKNSCCRYILIVSIGLIGMIRKPSLSSVSSVGHIMLDIILVSTLYLECVCVMLSINTSSWGTGCEKEDNILMDKDKP